MANDKKMVEQITSMEIDFAQWYTDVVKKAELVDYSGVKGCMIIRPYGYAIWENIQSDLDARFKRLGHENVYMPMFIPESLLQKEKDHVAGFAPECAIVTIGGQNKLAERLIVRPTSETLFCDHYKNIIHSYRDLPKLYNQWPSPLWLLVKVDGCCILATCSRMTPELFCGVLALSSSPVQLCSSERILRRGYLQFSDR